MLNIFVRVATLIKVEISWRVWLSNTMYLWLLNWVIGHAVAPPQSLYSFSCFPADTCVYFTLLETYNNWVQINDTQILVFLTGVMNPASLCITRKKTNLHYLYFLCLYHPTGSNSTKKLDPIEWVRHQGYMFSFHVCFLIVNCWTPEDKPIFVSISRYPFQFDNEIGCIAWARHPDF